MMLAKEGNGIAKIYVRWVRNRIFIAYFTPPKSPPIEALLRLSDADSAICFLGILSLILSSDYEVTYEADSRMAVFDIIANQTWGISKNPPLRPAVIEIKIYPGHRMMFVSSYQYQSVENEKFYRYSLIMEFATRNDITRTLIFLDDLLEENSSAATNKLDEIKRAIQKNSDEIQKIIYILKGVPLPSGP